MSEPTISELFDLSGRVAVVTGAAGHLGSSLSRALAEAGATVVVSSRDRSRAENFAKELPAAKGVEHHGVALDHFNEDSITSAVEEIIRRAGRIDVLVNNAHSGPRNDWSDISSSQFGVHLNNLTGYFLLARAFREHIVQRGAEGSVILLGSMYGQVASYPDAYEGVCAASPVAYHALKGGVIHMTRHLAIYWAQDRVRVNCLSPGPFPAQHHSGAMVARLCQKSPLGRMGEPWELKGAVVFLASRASTYMTGQNLTIDGGWTAW